jgi:hypothetical protein
MEGFSPCTRRAYAAFIGCPNGRTEMAQQRAVQAAFVVVLAVLVLVQPYL